MAGDPDRLAAAPPEGLDVGFGKVRLVRGIVKVVVDDAVVLGAQARHEGVVIGKGPRGEARDETPRVGRVTDSFQQGAASAWPGRRMTQAGVSETFTALALAWVVTVDL